MSNFVVSARKYRPIRFDDVVGQQHVSQTLKNAIRSNHLAQAFLFCGPRGVGKTTCARILAKVLNCLAPTPETEPCDTCDSCQSFNKNASLNISELDAASNNSVEHIRALTEQVRFAPQSGKYKIYIIDEVHMLSTQAFNAFLKTLEEPPSYAIFILATTEKHKIIPTILSRCQIFDFNRIQVADMAAHLRKICIEEEIEAEEEALNVIAQKADGALRDALSIFDRIVSFTGSNILYKDAIENLNILDYDYYFKIIDALLTEDISQLLLLFDQISKKGFDGDIFINGLAEHLRNILVCKDAQTLELLEVSGNIKDRYQVQATLVPTSLILSALSIANDCDINYKMARNKRLHVEMALIKMAYIQRAIHVSALPAIDSTQKKTLDNNSLPTDTKNLAENQFVTTKKPTEKTEKDDSIGSKEESNVETELKAVDKVETTKAEATTTSPIPKKGLTFAEKMAEKKDKDQDLLTKVVEEVKEEYEKPAEKAMPFTLENLTSLWTTYYEAIEWPSVQLLFKSAILSIENETTGLIKITVLSNRAKDAILRERNLKELLIKNFQKKELSFDLTIDEAEIEVSKPQNLAPQTDREKYVHFLNINPRLKDFQIRFNLFPPKNN